MSKYDLLYDISKYHISKITRRVIRSLIKIKSGYDCLENTWDEICVQMQSEMFITWNIYENGIEEFIRYELEKENHSVKTVISFIGEIEEFSKEDEEDNEYFYFEMYAVNEIMKNVLEEAGSYTNSRIRQYLDY